MAQRAEVFFLLPSNIVCKCRIEQAAAVAAARTAERRKKKSYVKVIVLLRREYQRIKYGKHLVKAMFFVG